jgi:hypothetical protein
MSPRIFRDAASSAVIVPILNGYDKPVPAGMMHKAHDSRDEHRIPLGNPASFKLTEEGLA